MPRNTAVSCTRDNSVSRAHLPSAINFSYKKHLTEFSLVTFYISVRALCVPRLPLAILGVLLIDACVCFQ